MGLGAMLESDLALIPVSTEIPSITLTLTLL